MRNLKVKTKILIALSIVVVLGIALTVIGILSMRYIYHSSHEIYENIAEGYEENAEIFGHLDSTYKEFFELFGQVSERSENIYNFVSRLMIVTGSIVIIIGFALAVYLPMSIAHPLKHMVSVADSIAEGDMEPPIKYDDRKDEVGQLQRALQQMKRSIKDQIAVLESLSNADLTVTSKLRSDKDTFGRSLVKLTDNLNKIVSEVTAVAEKVSIEAQQVAGESQELAQGTSEQASSIEELSSVVYEISLNTKENAEIALKAAQLSGDVRERAIHGEDLMKQMITAVRDTGVASKDIEKIIKVIEEIAFQTNILALNAAVEAAHAGQHGSGFAVVAAEVRNLASKSAVSAKESSALISKALEQISLGVDITAHTAESFKVIVEGIEESTQLIADIAKSSEEQAIAIEQINTGINQVANVIQINSTAAEKCAVSAEKMNDQAAKLRQTVSLFKMKNSANPTVARPRRESNVPQIKINVQPEIPSNDFGKY